MISFIIFNGESVNQILTNIGGLFGIGTNGLVSTESIYYLKSYLVVIIMAIIGSTPILKNLVSNKKITNVLEPIFLLLILIISTAYIVDGSFNPFLYFRF